MDEQNKKKRHYNRYVVPVADIKKDPNAGTYASIQPRVPIYINPRQQVVQKKRMSAIEPLLLDFVFQQGKRGATVDEIWAYVLQHVEVQSEGDLRNKSGRSSVSAIAMRLVDQKVLARIYEYYFPVNSKTGMRMSSPVRRHRYFAVGFAPQGAGFY